MAKIIELNDRFAIEESSEGRFLVDNWDHVICPRYKRLVDIGDIDVTYIKPKLRTIYCSFKVKAKNNCIGLIQLLGDILDYHDISCTKHCNDNVLNLSDVLVVPMEYEDVSIKFEGYFSIARKLDGLCDVFANGNKLQNASGSDISIVRRLSDAKYIPQIISYLNGKISVISKSNEVIFSTTDKQFPNLCFIENADRFASIKPSYQEFKTDIWAYNSNEHLGIVYLDSNRRKQSYVIDDIPFSSKNNVYFINENYIIYNFHDVNFLYFRGTYVGTISYFTAETKKEFFVNANNGFYIGKTFFSSKDFYDISYLHQASISSTYGIKELTLQSGPQKFKFTFNQETGCAKRIN